MRICGYEGEGISKSAYIFTGSVKIKALKGGIAMPVADLSKLINSTKSTLVRCTIPDSIRFSYPMDTTNQSRRLQYIKTNKRWDRPYILCHFASRVARQHNCVPILR